MTYIEGNIATVISGSYRRHLAGMYGLKRLLERKGIHVLSPVGDGAINPGEEFVLLDADPIHDHRTLQDSVFAKIRRSSFLVGFNREGYLGKAACREALPHSAADLAGAAENQRGFGARVVVHGFSSA